MLRVFILSLMCLLLPLGPVWAEADEQDSVILDDEDEAGFGIRLWGKKKAAAESEETEEGGSTPATAVAEPAAPKTPATEPAQNCIVLDYEDEDEDGVCGIPIRLPGSVETSTQPGAESVPAYDPELYRVVIDEEDETNESGFGIPLPTEDNPEPWKGAHSKPLSEDERFDDD